MGRLLPRWLARVSCCLALAPLACGAATAVEAGAITASSGDTRLVRGGSVATPLRHGVVVYSGDRLVTGPDARLEVRFADEARIAIGPSSEFKVDEYYFEPARQRSFFSLARGVMRQVSGAIGKRNHEDYKLTTPTGVLAIRGTEFIVKELECPKAGCAEPGDYAGLSVTVIKGRVAVSNSAGAVEVPAGSAVRLNDSATPPIFTAGPRAQAPFPRQILQAATSSLSAGDASFRVAPVTPAGVSAGSAHGALGATGAGVSGTGTLGEADNVRIGAGATGRPASGPAGERLDAVATPPIVPRIP